MTMLYKPRLKLKIWKRQLDASKRATLRGNINDVPGGSKVDQGVITQWTVCSTKKERRKNTRERSRKLSEQSFDNKADQVIYICV